MEVDLLLLTRTIYLRTAIVRFVLKERETQQLETFSSTHPIQIYLDLSLVYDTFTFTFSTNVSILTC